jgi:hypothetical protein
MAPSLAPGIVASEHGLPAGPAEKLAGK